MGRNPSDRIDPGRRRRPRVAPPPKSVRSHRPAAETSRPAAEAGPAAAGPLAFAVRARRRALRLTQAQLARLAGCGTAFLYDVESGKPSLRLDKLLDVLATLGLQLVVTPGKGRLSLGEALQ